MKRFTDTDKWRDPWFRKLSSGVKLAFLFIVDNCDNAGVWDADMELADFSIGMEIPWQKVRDALGDRMEVLKSGKWHLKKFVNFQFGKKSTKLKGYPKSIQRVSIPLRIRIKTRTRTRRGMQGGNRSRVRQRVHTEQKSE